MAEFLFVKRKDGSDALVNLDSVHFVYRGQGGELVFRFGKDDFLTVQEEERERLWQILNARRTDAPPVSG